METIIVPQKQTHTDKKFTGTQLRGPRYVPQFYRREDPNPTILPDFRSPSTTTHLWWTWYVSTLQGNFE